VARLSGLPAADKIDHTRFRTVRRGNGVTVFTIGYEKRDADDLISALRDAGVEMLADVREKPMSRKPDFRGAALRRSCEQAGIAYEGWAQLGSTEDQRARLHATSDFTTFEREFRNFAVSQRCGELDRLAERASATSVALLCYERNHDECHRSVVADLLADRLDATIVAL
jgi:uncharacterized protein (DUF488 family)